MNKILIALLCFGLCVAASAQKPLGPFFEPGFPFYQTQVDLTNIADSPADNFAVRGIVLPLGPEHVIAFDQDLLRVAGIWRISPGESLVTLVNMAQTSYSVPNRKCGPNHSKPTGDVLFASELKPGVATDVRQLATDPRRPNVNKDLGRGPLPFQDGRFEGIEIIGEKAVLTYRAGQTLIREWHEIKATPEQTVIFRHLEIAPHTEPVHFSCGAFDWKLDHRQRAARKAQNGELLSIRTNSDSLILGTDSGALVASFAPQTELCRVSLALEISVRQKKDVPLAATPPLGDKRASRRWPVILNTEVALNQVKANGLVLDRVVLPETNPWGRRVRSADIGFLSADRAVLVTYDGDVWFIDGLGDPSRATVRWSRFASGLHESLAIAIANGVVQVATKNGLVRLYDRDGDGEADWYENFSDAMCQSQSTRSFPLDMDIGPDGATYVSAGGIALGGGGTPFGGGVARVSSDGRTAELVSQGGREPYVTVHPTTGFITGTDQQGNYIPSSVCYSIRPGDHFGFGVEQPPKLTPPLAWIPHTEDNSSASHVWLTGGQFGKFNEKLLHLSYGNGGLFLICPDIAAPIPQAAVIPLGFDTRVPLLQGRMHPNGGSVFLTGFKIYDSRAFNQWGLARVRPSGAPITSAVNARSCAEGVILEFATPLEPESVKPEQIIAQAWNYKRSGTYGSGRYRKDGSAGMDPVGVSQTVLSEDRRSVFVHLPDTSATMQLEVRHSFKFENGQTSEGATYFTIHQLHKIDLPSAGFTNVDLSKTSVVATHRIEGPASAELGEKLSVAMGCIACHSVDGSREGRTGPTWKGLFGSDRALTDGSIESANEFYLRDSILNPQKKVVKGYEPAMASYKGVLTSEQIESLILYIRALK